MKKSLLLLSTILLFSCGVSTSDNMNIKGENLVYFKDTRTNLCFAAVASRKAASFDTTGLGLTQVPCDSVKHLIRKN